MGFEDGSAPATAAQGPVVGSVIGNYLVERELGRGGMGVVYAAVDQTLGKRVAVKVLLPAVSQRDDLVQRFFNEARAASTIRHPGIVEVFHYDANPDGTAYIVMEYLEGTSLAARLKSHGLLSIPSAIAIARQIALALAAAHRAGIVHRDLKPDNVFLVPDPEVSGGERVKLLDFGVAKLVDQPASQPVQTVTGAILGTPQYMSPEQCEGARVVDHRSDLYSLGCTLFQMVTGRLPFIAGGMGGMIGAHLYEKPPHARDQNPLVSDALDELIDRLLAKSPDARFQSGDEVATALADPATGAITQRRSVTKSIPPEALYPTELPGAPIRRNAPTRLDSTPITASPRKRRWWLPLLALAIAGGAAAAVFFTIRGREDNSVESEVTEAAEPSVRTPVLPKPIVTPAKPAAVDKLLEAKLLLLREAAGKRPPDFVKVNEYLTEIDATTDAAARAEANKIRGELHPAAIQRALDNRRVGIKVLVSKGDCKAAKAQVLMTASRWGPDPLLDQAVAGCKPSSNDVGDWDSTKSDPSRPGPIVTPAKDPRVTQILAEYRGQKYQTAMTTCLTSGPGVVLPQECIIAACKSDRLPVAAALLLRISLGGRAVDRGLNECKLLSYNIEAWLNTGNNRAELLARMRVNADKLKKLQDNRQRKLGQQTAPSPLDQRGEF